MENRQKILGLYQKENDIILSFGARKLSKQFINDFNNNTINLHRGII